MDEAVTRIHYMKISYEVYLGKRKKIHKACFGIKCQVSSSFPSPVNRNHFHFLNLSGKNIRIKVYLSDSSFMKHYLKIGLPSLWEVILFWININKISVLFYI